jgi:hypothetical protein
LIKPTSPPQNRRELVDVNWLYPHTRTNTSMRATMKKSSARRSPPMGGDERDPDRDRLQVPHQGS